ncbi:MAG TPA: dihydrofolate reductase family protein [Pseudonocardiaceae bacterium]|jgi:dihydrofolate reductase
MRKIVAGLFATLDGVVEAPEKWQFAYFNEEVGQSIGASMAAADAILLGRRTYEEFVQFWPHQTDDPFAGFMNNTPKYIVSTTLGSVDWQNSTLVRDNVVEQITELKQQPGRNINVIGSPTLVRSLLREKLLDELALTVCPVVIGTGQHLFEGWTDQVPLKLLSSTAFGTGAVSVSYEPAE